MTWKDGTNYHWNAASRLDSIARSGLHAAYRYDGWGRRVAKVVTDTTTRTLHFLWDGDDVIAEIDGSGALLGRFGYLGSTPLFLRRGSDTRYYAHGPAGTISGMFDEDRNVTHRYEYPPFGGLVYTFHTAIDPAFDNPLLFAGQYFDAESALFYMRARYYDPDLMRFISEDPIGLAGGINLYAYAGNDPINRRDPSGLIAERECDPCSHPYVWNPIQGDGSSLRRWLDDWLSGFRIGMYDIDVGLNEMVESVAGGRRAHATPATIGSVDAAWRQCMSNSYGVLVGTASGIIAFGGDFLASHLRLRAHSMHLEGLMTSLRGTGSVPLELIKDSYISQARRLGARAVLVSKVGVGVAAFGVMYAGGSALLCGLDNAFFGDE